jgi:hypothetical protein
MKLIINRCIPKVNVEMCQLTQKQIENLYYVNDR